MKMFRTLSAILLLAAPAAAQGGYLGVALAPPQEEGQPGAVVQEVQPRTAAQFLGLQPGDVVLSVDGQAVGSPAALAQLVSARLPGAVVDLEVRRAEETITLSGLLGRRPGAPSLGLGAPRGMAPSRDFVLEPHGFLEDAELEQLQRQMDELQRQLHQQLQQLDFDAFDRHPGFAIPPIEMPHFEMDFRMPEIHMPQFQLLLPEGAESSVSIRYPASTPEVERQRLIDEAVEKYGEGVDVKFEGDATIIQIQRGIQRGAATAPKAGSQGVTEKDEVF